MIAALLLLVGTVGAVARAQETAPAGSEATPPESRVDLHFQFTTVTQAHPTFSASYSGRNSLSPDSEHESTVTSTLFLGARLWKGAEIYVNPELSGGSGLGRALGIAGFPNGESFRVGDAQPRIYLARLMLRQSFAAGSEVEPVEEDANQLGGHRPVRRWTVTLGKFGVSDIFDDNAYSHDPRTQFLNWADWTSAPGTIPPTHAATPGVSRSNITMLSGRLASAPPPSHRSPMDSNSTRISATPFR
jgi:high affinity Mn2+ porin